MAPTKKAKTTRKRASVAKNAQAKSTPELLNFPVDVLLEIFGHTDAIDVLNLARTTKGLRRILMSKSSIGIWKRAMSNEALPPCPADMSIPAMLSLAADSQCRDCGVEHGWQHRTELFLVLGTRLCNACAIKSISCEARLRKGDADMAGLILDCIPTIKRWHSHCGYRGSHRCFLLIDKDQFMERYQHVNDKEELVEMQKRKVLRLHQELLNWEDWSIFIQLKQRGDHQSIIKRRAEEISGKLCQKGYVWPMKYLQGYKEYEMKVPYFPEAPEVCHLTDHPLVNVLKLFTEQEWERIKPQMVAFAELLLVHEKARNQKQLEDNRTAKVLQMYAKETQKIPSEALAPSLVDLVEWKPVQAIIKDTSSESSSQWIHQTPFEELFRNYLPSFIDQFRTRNLRSLVLKTPHQLESADGPEECIKKLKLATTVFKCMSQTHTRFQPVDGRNDPDYMPLFYPEFLHHMCNSVERHNCADANCHDWRERFTNERLWRLSVEEEFARCYWRKKWSSDDLSFDHKAQAVVERVISACGHDPATTTVAEIDGLDPRLVCLKCTFGHEPDGERVCMVFTWRSAVQHCLKKHWGNSTVHWRMISFEDTANARVLEKTVDFKDDKSHLEKMWRCSACRNTPDDTGRMTLTSLERHCKLFHPSGEPHEYQRFRYGVEYYKAVDAPPPQPKNPVRIKPRPAQGLLKAKDEPRVAGKNHQ